MNQIYLIYIFHPFLLFFGRQLWYEENKMDHRPTFLAKLPSCFLEENYLCTSHDHQVIRKKCILFLSTIFLNLKIMI